MEANKHTPGPWIAKDSPGAGLGIWADLRPSLGESFSKDFPVYGFGDVPVPKFQIAYEQWVQFPSNEFKAMQEANARLMAAAPDLLEALHNLEVSANTVGYCYDKRPENFAVALASLKDDAEEARAVLAKARGAA